MISKQAVYLDGERKRAVPDGHKDARFLLVREGHDIDAALLEKYNGASDLVTSVPKKRAEAPIAPEPPTLKGDVESDSKATPAAKAKRVRKPTPKKE